METIYRFRMLEKSKCQQALAEALPMFQMFTTLRVHTCALVRRSSLSVYHLYRVTKKTCKQIYTAVS